MPCKKKMCGFVKKNDQTCKKCVSKSEICHIHSCTKCNFFKGEKRCQNCPLKDSSFCHWHKKKQTPQKQSTRKQTPQNQPPSPRNNLELVIRTPQRIGDASKYAKYAKYLNEGEWLNSAVLIFVLNQFREEAKKLNCELGLFSQVGSGKKFIEHVNYPRQKYPNTLNYFIHIVNPSNHWFVCTNMVGEEVNNIYCFDSIENSGYNKGVLTAYQKYYNKDDFYFTVAKNIGYQKNKDDCGVFALFYTYVLLNKMNPENLTEGEYPYNFRKDFLAKFLL